MKYEKKYEWCLIDEKVFEDKNLHKIKIQEKETEKENKKWHNFSHWQTDDDRWKKHIDQWVDGLINSTKSKVK